MLMSMDGFRGCLCGCVVWASACSMHVFHKPCWVTPHRKSSNHVFWFDDLSSSAQLQHWMFLGFQHRPWSCSKSFKRSTSKQCLFKHCPPLSSISGHQKASRIFQDLPGSSRKSELKQPDHNGRYLTNNCTSEHDLNKKKSWWSNNLLCCVFLQFHVRVFQRLNLGSGPGIRVCPREAGNILKAPKAWDIRFCRGMTGMAIRKKKGRRVSRFQELQRGL